MSTEKKWIFYIISNNNYTYAGVSPDPERRLRQHNGEISGGAKYTISKGKGWKHVCLLEGFRNKIEDLQFEWAVKHVPPRNAGGLTNRIKIIYFISKRKMDIKIPKSKRSSTHHYMVYRRRHQINIDTKYYITRLY